MKQSALDELKSKLPKNWTNILAERTGKDASLISFVLSGKRRNLKVIKEAIALAKEKKAEEDSLVNEISNI